MFAAESHLFGVTHCVAFGVWEMALCVVGVARRGQRDRKTGQDPEESSIDTSAWLWLEGNTKLQDCPYNTSRAWWVLPCLPTDTSPEKPTRSTKRPTQSGPWDDL